MQILTTKTQSPGGKHLVFMFGLGMIGSSIRDALLDNEYHLSAKIEFDWQDAEQRKDAFRLIEASYQANSPMPDRVSVVWSAGKGAFHSTHDELSRENMPFMETVSFVSKLKESLAHVDDPELDRWIKKLKKQRRVEALAALLDESLYSSVS